jgi:hypothetical protein
MKISVVKMLLVIPFLLLLDWIIMVSAGSFSSICGASDHFFCTIYCYFGIALLVSTFLLIAYIILGPYLHLHRRNNV